jgi:hypothetical protein
MDTTTIFVYFTADSSGKAVLAYFPNNIVIPPPGVVSIVKYSALAVAPFPQPQFDVTTIQPTGTNSARVTLMNGATSSLFVAQINNAASDVASAGMTFKVLDPLRPIGPRIDGDSAIRNKGSSRLAMHWYPAMIFAGIGLVAGFAIGAAFGPNWHQSFP